MGKQQKNNKKKPYRKGKDVVSKDKHWGKKGCDQDESKSPKVGVFNDFSWYNNNPALTVAAASVPFPYKSGMQITSFNGIKYTIPGICSLDWAPFIGAGGTSTDPVNIAAREIFNRVRSSFSGSIDAGPPDFVIYFLALDSIFSYIGMLKRIYRVCATYTSENYNIPDTILLSMGFTQEAIQGLRANRVLLWQYINELVNMSHKFKCPDVFPVFKRHYWLNDNVYADAPEANSQMYVFRMQYALKYAMIEDPDTKISSSGLLYESIPVDTYTSTNVVSSLYTFGLNLINALSSSDDAFIISGYLTRAFEGTNTFYVDELVQGEAFAPLYVPEVLMQIENSFTSFGQSDITPTITLTNIKQDPSSNVVKTTFRVSVPVAYQNAGVQPYLNIRAQNPGVIDVVEASRLQTYYNYNLVGVSPEAGVFAGSEINLGLKVWNVGSMSVAGILQFSPVTNGASIPLAAALIASFDWHPFIFGYVSGTPVVVGDFHNYTNLSWDQVHEINKVCLYSEFNAFGIGQ